MSFAGMGLIILPAAAVEVADSVTDRADRQRQDDLCVPFNGVHRSLLSTRLGDICNTNAMRLQTMPPKTIVASKTNALDTD